jgi:hypothetical protein
MTRFTEAAQKAPVSADIITGFDNLKKKSNLHMRFLSNTP